MSETQDSKAEPQKVEYCYVCGGTREHPREIAPHILDDQECDNKAFHNAVQRLNKVEEKLDYCWEYSKKLVEIESLRSQLRDKEKELTELQEAFVAYQKNHPRPGRTYSDQKWRNIVADKEAELNDAWREAFCCDDIKLDQPLSGFISDLQHKRERLEAELAKAQADAEFWEREVSNFRRNVEHRARQMADEMLKNDLEPYIKPYRDIAEKAAMLTPSAPISMDPTLLMRAEKAEAELAKVRQETIEECCKAMCNCCRIDGPPKLDKEEGWRHFYDDGTVIDCEAAALRSKQTVKQEER